VALHGMHAARRQQAHQMTRPAAFLQRLDKVGQGRVLGQRAVVDGLIDARQVLQNHPSRAQIHMPHFRVAHLALGQPDLLGRSVQAPGRIGRHHAVPNRGGPDSDGVVVALRAFAPAVQNAQDDGLGNSGSGALFGHGFNIVSSWGFR